jgi:hypothetical protein
MRPTSLTDPVTDCGPNPVPHRHDPAAFKKTGDGRQEPASASLLSCSAVGRLGLLTLMLAALWAGVIWALH